MKHSSADTRKPYSGLSRSLVIAIDVGTTFSGVRILPFRSIVPANPHHVSRYPMPFWNQERSRKYTVLPGVCSHRYHSPTHSCSSQIPRSRTCSRQLKDPLHHLLRQERETHGRRRRSREQLHPCTSRGRKLDQSRTVCPSPSFIYPIQFISTPTSSFKLRLRPRTMQLNMNGMRLSALPKRKTAVHVFGDFLAYLYRCTRIFITDTHANGAALWNAVENDIQFVLSHPNGWEGAQQTKMRRAAVYGALIPDTNEGKARIRFVTEGEASLHACVLNGLAADVLSVCLFPTFSFFLRVNMGACRTHRNTDS